MAQQLLDAYKDLFGSLWDRMAVMLGRITTYTIMERTLYETGKDIPLINELALTDQGLDFTKLESKADQMDLQSLRDSMNSLVVNLVGVLAEQVGRTIAERIARKAVLPESGEEE